MAVQNLIAVTLPQGGTAVYDLDSFNSNYVTMGRGALHGDSQTKNMIQLDPACTLVSRAHCSFRRDARGDWYIFDDKSVNGLVMKGQRIQSRRLTSGDVLSINGPGGAQVVLQFKTLSQTKAQEQPRTGVQGFSSSFSLQKVQQCVIGRSSDCNIVINHPTASRRHCIITREKGHFYIVDNNSKNGTLLNAIPLRRKTLLCQDDRITIAGVSFIFRDGCLLTQESFGGVRIVADGVCKTVGKKKHPKTILDRVSLTIEPNQFVAVIGGSGAGKTSLLNCLAGLSPYTGGEVLINGEPMRTSGKSLRSLIGYVPQQDIVYDSLTLERMLYYSARLKMPPDASEKEIRAKIDETLELVELSAHKATLISKLSGGERKRASIAVELLASPRLFFLDEPSSGLDPGTEKHLMQLLKKLSDTGKTVVMVTHTVQNLDLCDRVVCMGRGGRLCFCGSPDETLAFFGKQNLTDIYDELNDNSAEVSERYRSLGARSGEKRTLLNVGKPLRTKKGFKAQVREFGILTRRYVEILCNGRLRLLLLLLLPIVLSLLVCAAFQADAGLYNLLLRLNISIVRENFPFLVAGDTSALLFAFSCAVFWTGIFNSIQEISKERLIFTRERFGGVSVTPYVLSKLVPQTVLCIIQSAMMCAVLALMCNTTLTVDGNVHAATAIHSAIPASGAVLGSGMMWLELYCTTLLTMLSAMCLGLAISALVSNELALVLCPVCLMPQILFSGVVGTLTGITRTISQVISCRWSCLAYFVSTNINELYMSMKYENGWQPETFADGGNTLGILDAAYELETPYVFGMNGVNSAWFMLLLMSAVLAVASVLILRFKRIDTR